MSASTLDKARRMVERALGMIDTLHLGPLDFNVFQAADYLRTAAHLVEQHGQVVARQVAP
jgi:hypothetical protein